MSTEIDSLLISAPEIRNGRPCIAGTGISVHRVAILHNLGHSPEDIVRKYEHLTTNCCPKLEVTICDLKTVVKRSWFG